MQSTTVYLMLALSLVSTAALLFLIGLRMPKRSGLGEFAGGLSAFAAAFVGQALDAAAPEGLLGMLAELAFVGGVLLLISGMRLFRGRLPLRWTLYGGVLAAYALIHWVLGHTGHPNAQELLTDVVVGALFGPLALLTVAAARRSDHSLRLPLATLGGITALIALLAIAHGVLEGLGGTAAMLGRGVETAYETYLVVAAVLIGPTLVWMVFLNSGRQLDELAVRDPMTRLLNRNGLLEELRHHFARRGHDPVSLLLLDLDHFARVNQLHGHAAGDEVLRIIAAMLEARLRGGDFAARLGGEEFLVGCVSANPAHAALLAERLRANVATLETGLRDGKGHLRCTVSVGVSRPFSELERWADALREAETALQAAKEAGRNLVACTDAMPVDTAVPSDFRPTVAAETR